MEICHMLGRLPLESQVTQWAGLEVSLKIDRISLVLSLAGSVGYFPTQQKHLQHFYKVLYSHPVARTSFSGVLKVPSLTQV